MGGAMLSHDSDIDLKKHQIACTLVYSHLKIKQQSYLAVKTCVTTDDNFGHLREAYERLVVNRCTCQSPTDYQLPQDKADIWPFTDSLYSAHQKSNSRGRGEHHGVSGGERCVQSISSSRNCRPPGKIGLSTSHIPNHCHMMHFWRSAAENHDIEADFDDGDGNFSSCIKVGNDRNAGFPSHFDLMGHDVMDKAQEGLNRGYDIGKERMMNSCFSDGKVKQKIDDVGAVSSESDKTDISRDSAVDRNQLTPVEYCSRVQNSLQSIGSTTHPQVISSTSNTTNSLEIQPPGNSSNSPGMLSFGETANVPKSISLGNATDASPSQRIPDNSALLNRTDPSSLRAKVSHLENCCSEEQIPASISSTAAELLPDDLTPSLDAVVPSSSLLDISEVRTNAANAGLLDQGSAAVIGTRSVSLYRQMAQLMAQRDSLLDQLARTSCHLQVRVEQVQRLSARLQQARQDSLRQCPVEQHCQQLMRRICHSTATVRLLQNYIMSLRSSYTSLFHGDV